LWELRIQNPINENRVEWATLITKGKLVKAWAMCPMSLSLTEQEKQQLVEYLKSL